MMQIAWEFIVGAILAAAVIGGIVYATYNYQIQSNRLEFEIQKVCIEGGGTFIRANQQCLFPAMPVGKVTSQ